eukprot:g18803.t1
MATTNSANGEVPLPLTNAASQFLQDIKEGAFNSQQTGRALQRLLDGAILERKQQIDALYHKPQTTSFDAKGENSTDKPRTSSAGGSPSKWRTPDSPVERLGDSPAARIMTLNDGVTPLTYKDVGGFALFPPELPAVAVPGTKLTYPGSGEPVLDKITKEELTMPRGAYQTVGPYSSFSGSTTPAAVLSGGTSSTPAKCRDIMKESNRNNYTNFYTKCYDPNLTPDEDATCDAVTRGVRSGTWACWAAPGAEEYRQNDYDDNWRTSLDPPHFFGSADRTKANLPDLERATDANGNAQNKKVVVHPKTKCAPGIRNAFRR